MTYESEKISEFITHPRLVGESFDYMRMELKQKATNTQYQYLKYFTLFLDEMHLDTEIIYNDVKERLNSEDRRTILLFEDKINSYLSNKMRENQWKKNTVNFVVKSLNFFLRANRLNYRYKFKPDATLKENAKTKRLFFTEGSEPVTHEETRRLIELTGNPRDHSILTMLKDSGLRVSDLAELRITDIRPILEDESIEFYTWELIPTKNMNQENPLPANPVIGLDALNYLRKWVKYAQKKYKAFTPLNDEDYVYFKLKFLDEGWTKASEDETTRQPLDSAGLGNIFTNTMRKGEFRSKISAHGYRKTHTTQLQAGGVPERWINVMQGKKGQGTMGIYSRPNTEELIEAYRNGYHRLQLESEVNSRIEELEAELTKMRTLETEMAKLREDYTQFIHSYMSGQLKFGSLIQPDGTILLRTDGDPKELDKMIETMRSMGVDGEDK